MNMSVCEESKHISPKATVIRFSRLSPQGHFEGFLSTYRQGETVLQGAELHFEPLLTLAQPALCHRINQKSWPQVAHRSHSHTMVSGRNSGCAHHVALPPKRKSITWRAWAASTTSTQPQCPLHHATYTAFNSSKGMCLIATGESEDTFPSVHLQFQKTGRLCK